MVNILKLFWICELLHYYHCIFL